MKVFSGRGSFRRRIILTFVGGFFLLISGHVAQTVQTESMDRYRDSSDATIGLAQSLAVSSLSWVLANDVVGLQEVVHAFLRYPELRYAMVVSPTGQVLAHSDAAKVGQFVSDERSLALLKAPAGNRILIDDKSLIDVAVPIRIADRQVGWARVGLGREGIAGNLRKMLLHNMIFASFATALSLLAAMLIANRLGRRIGCLVKVAEAVQAGNFDARASIPGNQDEITMLADSLNQMLDALARNEQRLQTASRYTRSLIEASLDPLVTISPSGKITDVNKATEEVTGKRRAELIGTDFSDYFTEPDQARKGYQQVFLKGSVTDYPLALRRSDGRITDVLYNASVYRDDAGEVLGVFAAARDITERKRNEAVNASRLHLVQFSLTHSLDELLEETLNETEKLTDSRVGFYHFVEDDQDSLTLQNWSTRTKAEFCKAEGKGLHYAVAEAGVWADCVRQCKAVIHNDYATLPYRKGMPEGHATVIRELVVPVLRGNKVSAVLGIGNKPADYTEKDVETVSLLADLAWEIAERKRAEEQLRRSEQGLAEAQRMAHLGNWNLDLVNNVLTWSDEIYRIFEIDPENFGASYQAFLDAIHPDDREMVNNAYTDSVRNRTPYDIVHRLGMKDGRVKYVNEKCVTYYGEDGMPLRSVGTVHDITELKEAEHRINDLNRDLERRVAERTAQLEAANKELEAFSYSVSHDLRTPLRAIDGFSRILLEDYAGKLDDEGKRLLNVVRDNTGRMGQLIDDILQFSRTGRLEINVSEIDMEGLARMVIEEIQPATSSRKLQVDIGRLPPAKGDRAMLRQVFVNLLSNAVKFSRANEDPRIEVGASVQGDEAVYFVKDNGVGFDMRYVDKLFGVFQRLHTVDQFEGTGIGLAIVKRIVTRHGGRVWAEGKVNEGATIHFTLPTEAKTYG